MPRIYHAERLQAQFRSILQGDPDVTLNRMRVGGRVVLNSDDLFNMFPEYREHPERRLHLGPTLYPVAREFTDSIYRQLLQQTPPAKQTVVFTAGGSACGKSSILRNYYTAPGVDFIVDTTFSGSERALDQVESALASGRNVEVHYVYRGFRDSVLGMVARALDPKSGRIVPVDDMARTHFGAQRSVLVCDFKYQDNPRV